MSNGHACTDCWLGLHWFTSCNARSSLPSVSFAQRTVGKFAGKLWGDEQATLVAAALAPRLNPDGTWIFNGALDYINLRSKSLPPTAVEVCDMWCLTCCVSAMQIIGLATKEPRP